MLLSYCESNREYSKILQNFLHVLANIYDSYNSMAFSPQANYTDRALVL
jgi:hypothetical protein